MRYSFLPLACLLVSCALFIGMKVADPPAAQMKTFADAFLATLDENQKEVAMVPYGSPKRVQWHFIPMETRKGLVLREMNAAQRSAALRLVQSALSEVGYDKASRIMMLEGVLREMEGEGRTWERDPNKYYLTIFGEPSEKEPWGLSFEGHHISLNFVCRDGRVVDSTPQFFASNPAIIMNEVQGPLGKGTRVLRLEEELAFKLVNSMSQDQQGRAIIAEEAPKEIRFAGEPQPKVGDPEGIPYRELSSEQQSLLKELVDVYVGNVADQVAEQRRELIEQSGWDNVHFAWAGATKPGIGHYYRIRGDGFLIELVNTQADPAGNPANHIHSVWRDVTGDFDLPNS